MEKRTQQGKLTNLEIASFCSEMAMILKSGISSLEGVDLLREDAQTKAEKELLKVINDFLGKLKAEDRDIFVRRYWFFDSVADISKRHAMSVGSVKMNLYRSRKKLLKVLKKEGKHL